MALHPGGTRAVSFHRGRTPGNVENRGVLCGAGDSICVVCGLIKREFSQKRDFSVSKRMECTGKK